MPVDYEWLKKKMKFLVKASGKDPEDKFKASNRWVLGFMKIKGLSIQNKTGRKHRPVRPFSKFVGILTENKFGGVNKNLFDDFLQIDSIAFALGFLFLLQWIDQSRRVFCWNMIIWTTLHRD